MQKMPIVRYKVPGLIGPSANSFALLERSTFDDSFLASPIEVVTVLVQLADRRSSRGHIPRDVLPEILSHKPFAIIQTQRVALMKTGVSMDAVSDTRQPRVRAPHSSSGRSRKHCKCGHCRWCLDNARWDRIFAERFDDPTYYGVLRVRHDSSLAGEC
jgi:hypothetical protein